MIVVTVMQSGRGDRAATGRRTNRACSGHLAAPLSPSTLFRRPRWERTTGLIQARGDSQERGLRQRGGVRKVNFQDCNLSLSGWAGRASILRKLEFRVSATFFESHHRWLLKAKSRRMPLSLLCSPAFSQMGVVAEGHACVGMAQLLRQAGRSAPGDIR